jgi:RES domain-containing protein
VSAVTVWRLCRKRHAADAFSGEGSRLFGGRWSPVGLRIAYGSESRSLAALEVLVNVRDPGLLFAQPWAILPATIPPDLIEHPKRVPENWRATPYGQETQAFGSEWAKAGRSVALRVPSAVVLGEFNYLLNPNHPDFRKIEIGAVAPFDFDSRIRH